MPVITNSNAVNEDLPDLTTNAAAKSPGGRPTVGHVSARRLGGDTLVYALGEVISRLAGFIMLPIYTRFLTPRDYGVIELLSMTIEMIGLIAGIGLVASVFKFSADAQTDTARRQLFSTAGLAVLVLALTTSIAGLLASPALGQLVFRSADHTLHFRIFFLIYLVQTAETVPFLFLRALQKPVAYVTLNVLKLLGMLTLNVYFVVDLKMGVLGVLVSNLVVNTILAAGLSIYFFRHVGFRFAPRILESLVRFGFPVVFWLAANFFMVFSDRYVLNHFTSTASVGIYSLAYKFAFVLTALAFTPFQMMWDPQRFNIARQANAQEVYRRMFIYLNIGLGGVATGLALFSQDVLRLMAAPEFHQAYRFVPLLLLAQIIYHWTAYCNVGLFLNEKTRALATVSGPIVMMVLGLNFLLIPMFGVYGAAIATLTAYTVRFLAIYGLAQREYHIDYRWSRVFRLYAFFASAVVLRALVSGAPLVVTLSASALLCAGLVLCVYKYVLGPVEQQFVRRQLQRVMSFPVNVASAARQRG
jgi:O-antigen/teichoic acid export membrane protein